MNAAAVEIGQKSENYIDLKENTKFYLPFANATCNQNLSLHTLMSLDISSL